MISIDKKILFTATKKTGKNSKEDDINYTLEDELYKKFIEDKKTNSVFSLATVCSHLFKNLLKIIRNPFEEYLTLCINSNGIRILQSNLCKVKKSDEFIGLMYFMGAGIFGDVPLIKCDRCEQYECKVDDIIVNLKIEDLDIIIKNITKDNTVYMFVNKTNYNTESNEASSIEFHMTEYEYKSNCWKGLGYNEITIPCKLTVDDNK
jgi:hypothetical protein